MSARAVVEAVRRGVQVVISSHSLELLDALVDALNASDDLDALVVMRLSLDDGVMAVSRFEGRLVRLQGEQIAEDLR